MLPQTQTTLTLSFQAKQLGTRDTNEEIKTLTDFDSLHLYKVDLENHATECNSSDDLTDIQ